MIEAMPPAFILLVAAILIGVLRGHARTAVIFIAPVLTLLAIWQVPDGPVTSLPFLDYRIEVVSMPTAGVGDGPKRKTFMPVEAKPAVSAFSNI